MGSQIEGPPETLQTSHSTVWGSNFSGVAQNWSSSHGTFKADLIFSNLANLIIQIIRVAIQDLDKRKKNRTQLKSELDHIFLHI